MRPKEKRIVGRLVSRLLRLVSDELSASEINHSLNPHTLTNLVIVAKDGRVFSVCLTLRANNTNYRRRDFIRASLQEVETRDDTRIYLEVSQATTDRLTLLSRKIVTVLRDIINRWRDFGRYAIAAVRVHAHGTWERMSRIIERFSSAHDPFRGGVDLHNRAHPDAVAPRVKRAKLPPKRPKSED